MPEPLSVAVRSGLSRLLRGAPQPLFRELTGLPTGDVVVTGVFGGLGNQMFQYAAARALALRTGAAVALDLSWFPTQTKQQFGLGKFDTGAAIVGEQASAARRLPVVKEQGFHFQPELMADAPASCYLEGYWQTERYFADAADSIHRDFRLEAPPLEGADRAVSVHVRRGDYVSEPQTLAYHGTCSLDYYARAMSLVRTLVPGATFRIFSDDPAWAQEHLTGPDAVVVSRPDSTPHEDLALMAQCRHHVIANSSFSWWGAWLSVEQGVTIAPRPWFLTPDSNTKDLLPSHWLSVGG